jgi:peptide subunit release factor 1 (eRF1)
MLKDILHRLTAMEPTPLPFLSAYIDLTPELKGSYHPEFRPQGPPPRMSWRRQEEEAPEPHLHRQGTTVMRDLLRTKGRMVSAHGPERESYDADSFRILKAMHDQFNPASKGAAIFACHGEDVWEVVELPVSIETRLIVDRKPFLSPLAYIEDTYEPYALCIANSETARIYVVALGRAESQETVEGQEINRTMTGSWSQKRIQQRIDNAVSEHIRDVAERLEEIVFAEDIPYIVLGGDEIAKTEFRKHLSKRAWERVVEMSHLDMKTPEHEAIAQTMETILKAEQEDARDLAQQAIDAALADDLGAAGPEAVIQALRVGAVDTLILSTDFEASGWRCSENAMLIGEEGQPVECPPGSGFAEKADLREEMTALALKTGAAVEFVEESDSLTQAGGVAAILRWRPDKLPERVEESPGAPQTEITAQNRREPAGVSG